MITSQRGRGKEDSGVNRLLDVCNYSVKENQSVREFVLFLLIHVLLGCPFLSPLHSRLHFCSPPSHKRQKEQESQCHC